MRASLLLSFLLQSVLFSAICHCNHSTTSTNSESTSVESAAASTSTSTTGQSDSTSSDSSTAGGITSTSSNPSSAPSSTIATVTLTSSVPTATSATTLQTSTISSTIPSVISTPASQTSSTATITASSIPLNTPYHFSAGAIAATVIVVGFAVIGSIWIGYYQVIRCLACLRRHKEEKRAYLEHKRSHSAESEQGELTEYKAVSSHRTSPGSTFQWSMQKPQEAEVTKSTKTYSYQQLHNVTVQNTSRQEPHFPSFSSEHSALTPSPPTSLARSASPAHSQLSRAPSELFLHHTLSFEEGPSPPISPPVSPPISPLPSWRSVGRGR